jgi:hypothetical protein
MLVFESLLDEVFTTEGEGMFNVKIHEYFEVVVTKSLLNSAHYFKENLAYVLHQSFERLLILW